jgi:hypothetical protein
LDPGTAAYIASAYALETRKIIDAEAFITEQHYCQQLMAAHSLKMHMVKTRARRDHTVAEINSFQCVTQSVLAATTSDAAGLLDFIDQQLDDVPEPTQMSSIYGRPILFCFQNFANCVHSDISRLGTTAA